MPEPADDFTDYRLRCCTKIAPLFFRLRNRCRLTRSLTEQVLTAKLRGFRWLDLKFGRVSRVNRRRHLSTGAKIQASGKTTIRLRWEGTTAAKCALAAA